MISFKYYYYYNIAYRATRIHDNLKILFNDSSDKDNGMKRLIVVFAACMVTLVVLIKITSSNVDTPGDSVFAKEKIYSPDGKYFAVLFIDSGGGAASGYCITSVSVAPANIDVSKAYQKKFMVYEGGCHSLDFFKDKDGQLGLESGPRIRWAKPAELEVIFNPALAKQYVKLLLLKDSSYNDMVKISYVPYRK